MTISARNFINAIQLSQVNDAGEAIMDHCKTLIDAAQAGTPYLLDTGWPT